MTARVHCWLLDHPRWGRPILALAGLQALAMIAVCAAPEASASANAMLLNWTGLKDSYGVPPGDYYLALASVPDQIGQAGPGVDWDPASWARWGVHALTVIASYFTTANILTAEAAAFVGIIALAYWVMKITVSTYWLTVVGEIARAVTGAVVHATTQLGLLLLAVPIGVFTGVLTIKRGEAGRGATMILVALTMPALSITMFADPAGEMYGPSGLLAFGRRMGFSVAEAARPAGALAAGGFNGQLDALTASLITHTVREPLQLWNFGHVVDGVGGCGAAWSAAVRQAAPDGPIRAMKTCGDSAAVAYAQHLDGTNIWVGAVFVAAALLLSFFMVVSGWAVLTVSVKAIWTTVILLPSLWLGAIPGAPQRRAMDVLWQFFRHGIEVMVYIVYVSVIGLAVEAIVARPLPAQLGGTNPFAHVLMMGGVSVAAVMLLRHIKADLFGRPPGPGLIGRAAGVAVGMGMHAAVGGAGSAALAGVRGMSGRLGWGRRTPWEQLEAAAANAEEACGAPRPGFEPVLTGLRGDSPSGTVAGGARQTGGEDVSSTASGVGKAGGGRQDSAPARPVPSIAPVSEVLGGHRPPTPGRRQSPRRNRSPGSADSAAQPPLDSADSPPASGSCAPSGPAEAAAVAPITQWATTGYGEQIPPPEQPPGPGEDGHEPPTDDPAPGPSSVDPISR